MRQVRIVTTEVVEILRPASPASRLRQVSAASISNLRRQRLLEKRMKTLTLLLCILLIPIHQAIAAPKLNAAEQEFQAFLTRYIAVVQPLMIKDNVASWDAAASGKASDYAAEEKYETAYKQFHANRATFAQLKRLKASGQVREPLLARQLTLIYNHYALNTDSSEKKLRPRSLCPRASNSFLTRIAASTRESRRRTTTCRRAADRKDSTKTASPHGCAEVGRRNGRAAAHPVDRHAQSRAAREMGYKNFYEMSLRLDEQEPQEVFRIFDELAARTDAPSAR